MNPSKVKPKRPVKVNNLKAADLINMKKKLKQSYSMNIDGKPKAPSFINTLKDVTGHGSAEKIANLRRVLSTCRKMGVPLVRSDGKKFKEYKYLDLLRLVKVEFIVKYF